MSNVDYLGHSDSLYSNAVDPVDKGLSVFLSHQMREHPIGLALIVADGALIVWLHLTVRDCNELPDIFQTNYWVRGFLDLVLQPYGDLSSGGLRVLDRNNFQWHHSLSLVPQLLCQGQLRQ